MIQGRCEKTVTCENTAKAVGSGSLLVFATPALTALMEEAACNALEGRLEPGMTTVGTEMNLTHESATPVGMRVWAEAELTASEGRSYTFVIKAYDEAGLIGQGTHKRFAVQAERFQDKTDAKKG